MYFSPSHHIIQNSSASLLVVGLRPSSLSHFDIRALRKAAIVPRGKKDMRMRETVVMMVRSEADCLSAYTASTDVVRLTFKMAAPAGIKGTASRRAVA
jgi:hypothetical protein